MIAIVYQVMFHGSYLTVHCACATHLRRQESVDLPLQLADVTEFSGDYYNGQLLTLVGVGYGHTTFFYHAQG